jgi:subtilisin family serine protease
MRPRRRILTAVAAGIVLALAGATAAHADQVRGMEYWLGDYGVSRAWATTRGAGVTVAVIDTGIDASVPDLAGAVIGGTDVSGIGTAGGQKPLGGGESGHGTWVASMLAGAGHGSGQRHHRRRTGRVDPLGLCRAWRCEHAGEQ